MQWLGIAPPEGAASLTDAQQSIANIIQNFQNLKIEARYSLRDAETEKIFATAKEKFGTTYDMREAGYILPDGSMLDFSGRHQVRGGDTSFLNGNRTVDHREIEDVAYDFDENETGVLEEIVCYLVEKLPNAKIKAIFTGELSVKDYTKALREDFEVMNTLLPIIEKSVEQQKEHYEREKATRIVIPRVSSIERTDRGAKGGNITNVWEGREGEDSTGADSANREEVDKVDNQGLWRGYFGEEPVRRGGGERRVLTPTRYSVHNDDMPFFDAVGQCVRRQVV